MRMTSPRASETWLAKASIAQQEYFVTVQNALILIE
jgi:hypothetical protein